MPLQRALLAAVLLSASARPASAQATAMFRGDAAHGGRYADPGAAAYGGLRWRFQTDGPVRSSPAVTTTTVYIGSNDGHLYALDRQSGTLRWKSPALGQLSSSPAVAGGVVVITTPTDTRAFNARNGAQRWRVAHGPALPFPWGHESGDRYVGSPVISNDVVVVGGGDGVVRALTLTTGAVRWSTPLNTRLRSTPAIADGRVVVGGVDGSLYALALTTGATLWRFRTVGDTLHSENFGFDRRTIQSSPAIQDGLVIVGARDGFGYAVSLRDGVERWRVDHKVSWINASAALADGMAIWGSSDGHFMQAVELSTGKERWRAPSENIVWGSAAVAGGMVFVGEGSGLLHALDLKSGAERWRWRAGGGLFSSPVVADSTLYLGSDDGGVYAVALTAGPPLQRAVFWDSSLVASTFFRGHEPVRHWLRDHGYAMLDANGLTRWLDGQATGAPSVIVFAMDALPSGAAPALRRYLDQGGKVVWLGVPPTLWPRGADGGLELKDVDRESATRLLGVGFEQGNFDPHGATSTAAGLRWGLTRWHVSNWGADPKTVTDVLAMDDEGLAASWVRRFSGRPGSGFVRLFGVDWGGVSGVAPSALAVQVAAEYFPR
ncbi:MAG: PQQ-binding-like beta-propeller repeat protein [Gemmatimonadetes bacterium]|nr:PQQ-binding-like beta-propeller repeat protein [Gemmatimonadota bacterium]